VVCPWGGLPWSGYPYEYNMREANATLLSHFSLIDKTMNLLMLDDDDVHSQE
tara:strand:+ start:416 stop:571 length:156 start_codon:yes stop_codon:yes gene_type:complete